MTLFNYKGCVTKGLAVGLLCAGMLSGCTGEKVAEDPLAGYRMATVDMASLVELHPNSSKLLQMQEELEFLKQQKLKIQNESREKLISKGGDEMQAAMGKAKEKLEAERAQVEAEISGLAAHLSGRIESEMHGLQGAYEAELKAEIQRLAPPPEAAPSLDATTENQLQDYLENLSLVRERNLAAKRLELEKRVGDEISAKKAEVDGQIAAYEADLSAQYQNEKLNLQLTAQNSSDEEAKAAAEARLGEISNEIAEMKASKSAELNGGYAALRADKTAALQGDLAAYQQELDTEVQQKLAAKRTEIGLNAPRPVAATSSGPPPEVRAKIKQIEGRMQAQLASKKAALESQMKAKMADSEARLKAKQIEVEDQLIKLQADIEKRVNEGLANLPDEVKAELDSVDKKIEKLKEERKKLYAGIQSDINTEVAVVAEKKEQEMVLGVTLNENCFFTDPSFADLTDLSQVRVQQMEAK